MDIFKFNNPTASSRLEQGEIVNDIQKKLWIERYRSSGEFEFSSSMSSGLREKLPVGSFVSHVDTTEVMIVENHEIVDEHGEESQIIVSGRGFETFLEQRIVGSNRSYPMTLPGLYQVDLAADDTWKQAVTLIQEHIYTANTVDDNDALPYLTVLHDITGTGSTSAYRVMKRGSVYLRLLELLAIDDLGIKAVRPGPWSPLGSGDPNTALVVHKGVDRSDEIIFSYDTGEIESADYLWSNKKLRNSAYIYGRWVETRVDLGPSGFERRMLQVDASDLDNGYEYQNFTDDPTLLSTVEANMQRRGLEALASHNAVELTKAEVSKDVIKAGYRKDFNVGDIISVSGGYNTSSKRRISEYVEIEDQNGSKKYPTLSSIQE